MDDIGMCLIGESGTGCCSDDIDPPTSTRWVFFIYLEFKGDGGIYPPFFTSISESFLLSQ